MPPPQMDKLQMDLLNKEDLYCDIHSTTKTIFIVIDGPLKILLKSSPHQNLVRKYIAASGAHAAAQLEAVYPDMFKLFMEETPRSIF